MEMLSRKLGLSKTPDGYEPLKDEDLEALATQMDAAALRSLADQVELSETVVTGDLQEAFA